MRTAVTSTVPPWALLPLFLFTASGHQNPLPVTRVQVSQQQLRISIPIDTSWMAGPRTVSDSTHDFAYRWVGSVEGAIYGYAMLMTLARDTGATMFAQTHTTLAQRTSVQLCEGRGMISQCNIAPVFITQSADSIILTVRDSARISDIFRLRPEKMSIRHDNPLHTNSIQDDTPIAYVAPFIPIPDSTVIATARETRQRIVDNASSIRRDIKELAGRSYKGTVWIVLHDTADLYVRETSCHYDACGSYPLRTEHSAWTVEDSTIAHLLVPKVDTIGHSSGGITLRIRNMDGASLAAKRLGRTVVRVEGIHSAHDTTRLARRSSLPATLQQTVVVIPPVSRVTISVRTDTVTSHQPFTVWLRVYDQQGRVIPGVPVGLKIENEGRWIASGGADSTQVTFWSPGKQRMIASFRESVDTTAVYVREREVR